ncbi:hypothetical protein LPB137_05010 [Poseidonibacter parvus]|uniref:Uncharacterized protein n=1 Tax=Poseidonibacter parvus TaxID=1850254 RepID=A0A1P8KL13_9BACT|nr:hypothetical protein [Poseidonibacter parvus]APW65248.1 hypothetical protein LPB137_05010 [Poseidonibacter parvus]
MKRLTQIVLGLGLMASSSLMASDTISALYPLEDNDTPDYILSNNHDIDSKVTNKLAKASVSKDTLLALYPLEDNDTPDYLLDRVQDNQSSVVYTAAKSSINAETVCALFPEEDVDGPRKSC